MFGLDVAGSAATYPDKNLYESCIISGISRSTLHKEYTQSIELKNIVVKRNSIAVLEDCIILDHKRVALDVLSRFQCPTITTEQCLKATCGYCWLYTHAQDRMSYNDNDDDGTATLTQNKTVMTSYTQ